MNVLELTKNEFKLPEIKTLAVKDLKFANYQRKPEFERYKEIAYHFDSDKFQTVTVSYRDGQYWIVDGGHRVNALELMGVETVHCTVMRGLTYEEEARKFVELNTKRKTLGANAKFFGLIESRDSMALDILRIMTNYGFKASKDSSGKKDNCIAAIGACSRMYKKKDIGYSGFAQILRIIREAWSGTSDALSVAVLNGIGEFIRVFRLNESFDEKLLIKVLQNENPKDIENYAKKMLGFNACRADKTNVHVAKVILEFYNKKAKEKLSYPACWF